LTFFFIFYYKKTKQSLRNLETNPSKARIT